MKTIARSDSSSSLWTVLVGLAITAVYMATLYPSVPGGDAGELIAAVATTGVPHPPGYPLYVLVTKPFLWLPVANVAWRANLASAVMAACAAAVIAWAVAKMTGRRWAGVAAAGVFAFSPTVWLYAVGAEVFSLNNLCIAAELALLVAIDRAAEKTDDERRRRDRWVWLGALVFGLGLTNHLTSLFVNGIFLAGMLWRVRAIARWRSAKPWLILVALVAVGGLPYLYLPFASAGHPLIEWGQTSTLTGLISHLLRREYGTFELGKDLAKIAIPFVERLGFYARDLVDQVTWLGVALALWGLVRGLIDRSTRILAVTTASAFSVYLCVLHGLERLPLNEPLMHGVVARFWQAPNLIVCVWIGLGLASLRLPAAALATTAVVLVGGQVGLNLRAADHRHDTVIRDYGAAILESLPPHALVLMRGDIITNPLRYLQDVEHLRPDLRLLDLEMLTALWMTPQVRRQMPDVVLPGTHYAMRESGAFTIRQLVEANIATRPVVLCGGLKPGDSSLDGAYRLLWDGWCDRLVPIGVPVDPTPWLTPSPLGATAFHNDMRIVPPADSWERIVWTEYWDTAHRKALALLMLGIERHNDPALLRAAADGFSRLIAEDPIPPPYAYKNLGIALGRLAPVDPTAAARAVEAWQVYLRVGPVDDADRPAIAQAMRELSAIVK